MVLHTQRRLGTPRLRMAAPRAKPRLPLLAAGHWESAELLLFSNEEELVFRTAAGGHGRSRSVRLSRLHLFFPLGISPRLVAESGIYARFAAPLGTWGRSPATRVRVLREF